MSAPVRALSLLIPHRTGDCGQTPAESAIDQWPTGLRRPLRQARRRRLPSVDHDVATLDAFGLTGDQPVAALQAAGLMGREQAAGYWMLADPLYLHPDRDHLLVFDASTLSIQAPESKALVDSLNDLYRPDGWLFYVISASQWLVQVPTSYAFQAPALAEIRGKSLAASLPTGADARFLVNRLNEIQMLFQGHPVNEKRLEQEQPPINGVWLSGLSHLPETSPACRYNRVLSNDALVRGIADCSGLNPETLPEPLSEAFEDLTEGHTLIDCRSAGIDPCVSLLENAMNDLRRRHLTDLHLYPGDGYAYHLQRSQRLKFWVRA